MADVLIIGGGLTGLLAARELSLAGAEVALVERGELARESSWAGGGILSPLYPWRYPEAVTVLASWSQERFPELAAELAEATGIDPEYEPSGLLIQVPADQAEAIRWASLHDVEMVEISANEALELEPRLGPEQGGLWMPQIGQVRNPRLLQSLIKYLEQRNVVFHTSQEVTGLIVDSGRVQGVKIAEAASLAAEKVVVAGGAWSKQILGELGHSLKVEPVKGQMLLYKARPGMVKHIVLADSHYVIPRRDGNVLVGSTLEYTGFDKSTSDEAHQQLVNVAERIIPTLADFPITHHWAGLRPGSPDGIPYISEHPEVSGLFISAGHFRNGVVTGPASARVLADLILGRETAINPMLFIL